MRTGGLWWPGFGSGRLTRRRSAHCAHASAEHIYFPREFCCSVRVHAYEVAVFVRGIIFFFVLKGSLLRYLAKSHRILVCGGGRQTAIQDFWIFWMRIYLIFCSIKSQLPRWRRSGPANNCGGTVP